MNAPGFSLCARLLKHLDLFLKWPDAYGAGDGDKH